MEKSDVAPWLHVGTQQPHPRCTRQPCLAHCVTGPWRYMKLFWAGVTSAASIKMSSSSLHWIRTLRVRDGVIVWVASTSSQSSSHPSRHRHWVSKVTYIFMLFSFFIEVFFNSWQRTNTVVTVLCRAVDHTCVAVQSPSSLSSRSSPVDQNVVSPGYLQQICTCASRMPTAHGKNPLRVTSRTLPYTQLQEWGSQEWGSLL